MAVKRHALEKAQPASPSARSRVSNGKDILHGIDGRTLQARRYRDIISSVASDLGGLSACSEVRMSLIRRFASICVITEQVEARLAMGESVKPEELSTLSSTLVRLALRIGLDRVIKDVTPTLDSYLSGITDEDEDDSANQRLTDQELLAATEPREAAE